MAPGSARDMHRPRGDGGLGTPTTVIYDSKGQVGGWVDGRWLLDGLAPGVGLEPTALGLTGPCSAD